MNQFTETLVSIQLISLASRELKEKVRNAVLENRVSIQLISLASREHPRAGDRGGRLWFPFN